MRGLVAIAIGIAAIVVIAVAAVAAAGSQGPSELEAGTPEAVVQEYLTALEDGDTEAAYALFSESVREDLTLDDFERSINEFESFDTGIQRTVYFDETEITGDSADVYLTVEETFPGEGGFGIPPYTYPVEIPMVSESGEWRIDEPLTGISPYYEPTPPI
jgi:hypothetical protein